MGKITAITPEQIGRFSEWTRKWIEVGLSTAPADFDTATAAALKAYELANLKRPMVVLRMSSPYGATVGGAMAWAFLREFLKDGARSQVESQVWSQVESQVGSQVWSLARDGWYNYRGGAFWASWCAYVSFFRDVMGWQDPVLERFKIDEDLCRSCGWVWWHENVLAISDRPEQLHRDDQGRLHCATGPSIAYRDGWALHHWHGVSVPAQIIERPQDITIEQIRGEGNAEVRRVMIERYGYGRYLHDAGLVLVDQRPDDDPIVGLRTAKLWRDGDLVLLDMLNSTPEPDGSVKRYVLSVDGEAYDGRAGRECLAAMASTWRKRSTYELYFKRPEDYRPMAES